MTVRQSSAGSPPQIVELGPSQISVTLKDGTQLIDADVAEETFVKTAVDQRRTVDIFVRPRQQTVILTDERFRSFAAGIWGPVVRAELASDREKSDAQASFTSARIAALQVLEGFQSSFSPAKLGVRRNGGGPLQLYFTNAAGKQISFSVSTTPSSDPRRPFEITSLVLESNGLRVVVNDPAVLDPLRATLTALETNRRAGRLGPVT